MRSLKQQILLLVVTMVLGTIVTCLLVASFQFERRLSRTAARQTETLAAQLASILQARADSTQRYASELLSIVKNDTLPRRRRAALAAFAANRPDLIGVAVWRPDSAQRIFVAGPAADAVPARLRVAHATPDSTGAGPIRAEDNLLAYDITLPIPGRSPSAESLIVRSRIPASDIDRLVAGLGSSGAVLLLGIAGGNWSDLSRKVDAPRIAAETEYRWKGDSIYDGASVNVSGTPWNLWVGMPRASLDAASRTLAANIAGAGLIVLLLATLTTLWLVRHLTEPLDELNRAMARVAEGHHRERVPEDGPTEVLSLAETFNVMADRIEEGTDRLEHLVEQRTRELEAALTELRDTQEQLVRNERLATLGQLASVIGNELRTPLRAMTNAIYYLEMMSHNAAPAVKENYGILRYQMLVAEKIVADLLDFAQSRPPQKERADLRAIADEQIGRLGKMTGVSIIRKYDPAAAAVFVDPIQVGQAIFNVLTNAVQAIDDGGTITVRTFVTDDFAGIVVEDSGPGIRSQDIAHIFEPLFTTKSRGIGLGLSVAKGLIEGNGGRITVSSESGSGACFGIQLPRA